MPPLAPTAPRPEAPVRTEPPLSVYDADRYDPEPPAARAIAQAPRQPGTGFWRLVAAGVVGAAITVAALAVLGVLNTNTTTVLGGTGDVTEREIITLSGDGTSPVAGKRQ